MEMYSLNSKEISFSSSKGLIAVFRKTCKEFPKKPAFIHFNNELSFSNLENYSLKLASYFQCQGLKKGDRIILQLPNIFQYPVSFWASIISGLVIVNMNPFYTAKEMLQHIKEVKPKAIILLSNNLEKLEEIIGKTSIKIVITTNTADLLKPNTKQSHSYLLPKVNSVSFLSAVSIGSKDKVELRERDENDTLLIQHTGGTTGVSKGACLSHKNILLNCMQVERFFAPYVNKGKEQALALLPFYHIGGLFVNGLYLFFQGATNIFVDSKNSSLLIEAIKANHVTTGLGLNTLFRYLLNHPEFKALNFSDFKFFLSGGMALDDSIRKEWEGVTKTPIVEVYGLTESPLVSANIPKNIKRGSIGLPLPLTKVRIRDVHGNEKPFGQEGELEVQGPQVMKGYYGSKEDNTSKPNNWLKTGDIAELDREGFIYLKGRKKEMIIVSGFNVFPAEVEKIIYLNKKVKETTVFGLRKEDSVEEVVKAVVVRKDNDLTEEELKTHCRKYLTRYKVPKVIEFRKTLPKSTTGKILRRKLISV